MCLCGQFVDENGYGACTKRDKKFGNMYTCYVFSGLFCNDMKQSPLQNNMYLSAQACEDKNERMILSQTLKFHY